MHHADLLDLGLAVLRRCEASLARDAVGTPEAQRKVEILKRGDGCLPHQRLREGLNHPAREVGLAPLGEKKLRVGNRVGKVRCLRLRDGLRKLHGRGARVDVDKVIRTNERGRSDADGALGNGIDVALLGNGCVMEDETRTGDRGRGTTAHADKLVLLVENLEVTADGRLGGAKHGHELLRGDRSTLVHEPNDDVLSLTRKHARHPHGSLNKKHCQSW